MVDNFKLLASALLVAAGIAGFYLLSEMPTVVRVVSVLAGLAAAAGVAWFTAPGKQFYAFSQEAVTEARKVVWPTRKETMQMTGVVAVFVFVMALFLWLVDGSLMWLVKLIMGRGE
ncbi:MAG: preprotein translocase subunit SecE [Pseudomonadota bacterium]